jgi:hypothetical protein
VDVAAAEHHFVRFQGGNQSLHDIRDEFPPFLPALLFQTANPDIILEYRLPVRERAPFHRCEDAVHKHGRTEASV